MQSITNTSQLHHIHGGAKEYIPGWRIAVQCSGDILTGASVGLFTGFMMGSLLGLGDLITGAMIVSLTMAGAHWAFHEMHFCHLEPGYYSV